MNYVLSLGGLLRHVVIYKHSLDSLYQAQATQQISNRIMFIYEDVPLDRPVSVRYCGSACLIR